MERRSRLSPEREAEIFEAIKRLVRQRAEFMGPMAPCSASPPDYETGSRPGREIQGQDDMHEYGTRQGATCGGVHMEVGA